jgi:endonuclease YncB( thermonuclease family)
LVTSQDNKLVRVKFGKFDLYGRPLVDLFVTLDNNEVHINELMVREGHGRKYDGHNKEEW